MTRDTCRSRDARVLCVLGFTQSRKLPFTPILLQRILHKLDLKSIPDSVLWGAIVLAFFSLLRRSRPNVLCSPATFNPSTSLCRRDVVFMSGEYSF